MYLEEFVVMSADYKSNFCCEFSCGMLKMWLCDFEHYHDQHSITLSVCTMHAVCNENGSSVYCCINILLL